MKIAKRSAALGFVGLTAAGCAIFFPANNLAGNFTAITFSFTVAGSINAPSATSTGYIYDVALTATSNPSPLIGTAPLPVVNSSSPNGRVSGSPTQFIEFNPNNPSRFDLNRFALTSQGGNTSDPSNPINLASWSISPRGIVFNPQVPEPYGNGPPNVLTFTVYTNELVDSDDQALSLKFLQVNILTMTTLANAGGTRILDALGDTRSLTGIKGYLTVDLRTSSIYQNSVIQLEPIGDTLNGYDPDVDISDFTITVQSVTGQGSGSVATPL